MIKVCVYHHNDADGLGSAAVIHRFLRELSDWKSERGNPKPIFHMCNHHPNELLPVETFRENDEVYVVDYALPVEYARTLIKNGIRLTWIDHHQSAIEKYDGFEYDIPGIRKYTDYESAIKLCWKYFFPDNEIPYAVELISDYDSWKWVQTNFNDANFFVTGLEIEDISPDSYMWDFYFDGELIQDAINNGIIVDKYRITVYQKFLEASGYDIEFEGHKTKVLNAQRANKPMFKKYFDTHSMFISWAFSGDGYIVSLYTNDKKINVGTIAKKFGGGGHAGAAGFACSKLPF